MNGDNLTTIESLEIFIRASWIQFFKMKEITHDVYMKRVARAKRQIINISENCHA